MFFIFQSLLQKEDYLRRLDGLVERINGSIDNFKFDRKSLANILAGLQQFMEDALGVNVSPIFFICCLSFTSTFSSLICTPFLSAFQALTRQYPKVPAKLFHDTNPDGPLATIGRLCAELMKSKNMKRIDWVSPATRKDNIDLVLRIRQELLRAGFIRRPRIFVRPDCPQSSALRQIVTKLNGEIAHAEDAPGVTHVVYPFGPNGDPDDGKAYLRSLELGLGAARVHWWYLPDSYDEWLPAAAAPAEIDPYLKPPGSRPWKVYFRFLSDSEKYNEWMNEADYETEESAAENKRAREAGEGDGDEAAREKKKAKKSSTAVEVAPGLLESIAPGAATRRLLNPSALILNPSRVEDISQGQRQEWTGIPVAAAAAPPLPPLQPTPNDAAGGGTAPRAAVHRIPAMAHWFKFNSIHAIERAEFPEFYEVDTRRSADQFTEIRNRVISKFHQDPGKDLTFEEALKGMNDADAGDVRKIFDFLIKWGIINWRDSASGGGGFLFNNGTAPLSGTDALLRVKKTPTPREAAEAITVGTSGAVVRPGTFQNAVPQAPAVAQGVSYLCNIHPYENITAARYHCTRLPDVDICPEAYADGKFPPGCSAKDFIRVTATDAVADASGWSQPETLLLLEGLEMYGEDWGKIAQHVGGRSPLQCLQRVLQMPIEDSLLPRAGSGGVQLTRSLAVDGGGGEKNGDADGNGGVNGFDGPLPFADIGNPVMAQVAFLTLMVGPRVAAAAAQRALEVLAEEDATGEGQGLPEPRVRAAAAAGLAAAAVKARLTADAEEREMQRLVVAACENQLRRVQAKLIHLEKVDELVKAEFAPAVQRAMRFEAELAQTRAEGGGGGGQQVGDGPPVAAAALPPPAVNTENGGK